MTKVDLVIADLETMTPEELRAVGVGWWRNGWSQKRGHAWNEIQRIAEIPARLSEQPLDKLRRHDRRMSWISIRCAPALHVHA